MTVYTLGDLARLRRCPYEFALDRRTGVWRITSSECLQMAIRDAVLESERRRVTEGRAVDADTARSFFWESWDRHFADVFPQSGDTMGLIRFGERCMDGYTRLCVRDDVRNVAAIGVSGSVPLPGGDELVVSMDSVVVHGSTATVCVYVPEPRIRTSAELAEDRDMRACAYWVLGNVSGCDRVRMRWMFLGSGTVTEASASRRAIESAVHEVADLVAEARVPDPLPRESDHCPECPYLRTCPRKIHELMVASDPSHMSMDEGVRLVDEYAEVQEKIEALRSRQRMLEAKRDAVSDAIVAFADANGFMSVTGHGCKALVRHERRVELPEDKTEVVRVLRETGLYDGISMPNYPRLRSEIAKGTADPRVAELATVTEVGKVYFKRAKDRGSRHHAYQRVWRSPSRCARSSSRYPSRGPGRGSQGPWPCRRT